jgi:hypothetical protein
MLFKVHGSTAWPWNTRASDAQKSFHKDRSKIMSINKVSACSRFISYGWRSWQFPASFDNYKQQVELAWECRVARHGHVYNERSRLKKYIGRFPYAEKHVNEAYDIMHAKVKE